MKTEQQTRDYLAEQKRWFKLMDGADPEFRLVEGMIEALEFVLDRKNGQPEPDLPDGLQEYMQGVARNILHRNYHKSTNGIWSDAVVECSWEQDEDIPAVWEVYIDFGCQDDTRNEQYREEWYFFQKDGEWTCDDVSPIDADWLEESDAMERHKDNL